MNAYKEKLKRKLYERLKTQERTTIIYPGLNRDGDYDNDSDDDDDNLAMIRLPKKKKIAGGDPALD